MDLEAFFLGTKKYETKLNKEEIKWMKMLYEKSNKRDYCFLFLRENESEVFVEIFHWHKWGKYKFDSYIIGEGHILTAFERVRFDDLCTGKAVVDDRTVKKIYLLFAEKYPQIYLKCYENPLHMLHHLYCTINRQTEELFYKSDLSVIGLYLNSDVLDYNILGTSPKDILGMPVKLLKTFNSRHGIEVLATEARRQYINQFYQEVPNLFSSKWTLAQCKYFCEMYSKNVSLIDSNEQRDVLYFLSKYNTYEEYGTYMEYRRYTELLSEKVKVPLIPDFSSNAVFGHFTMLDVVEKMEYLYDVLFRKKDEIDAVLYSQYQKDGKYLEYEDDTYIIRCPRSIEELIQESEYQHNCIWTYDKSLLLQIHLLFLRKKSSPYTAFVDIEVKCNKIVQAKGRFNMEVPVSVRDFLKIYAEEKELVMAC